MSNKRQSGTPRRRVFKCCKYAAFNLLTAKWMQRYAAPGKQYCYITLGGTELHDVSYVCWIDEDLISTVRAYEQLPQRYALAQGPTAKLAQSNINIELVKEDIFQYGREQQGSHIFFFDFESTCSGAAYQMQFQRWFEEGIIRPGDVLLITSYLGRNRGWDSVLRPFDGKFRVLEAKSPSDRKNLYKVAHPAFLLLEALRDSGLDKAIRLDVFGFVKYYDTSPMGLYAFACESGETTLELMVNQIPVFDAITMTWKKGWK